jgi:hypothetical protein
VTGGRGFSSEEVVFLDSGITLVKQQRGQPRRGREGVLLLPRQHADSLVHEASLQVSADSLSCADLIETNRRRSKNEFEYELLDTGVFNDDRYYDVFVEYAKESSEDILISITAYNRGPQPAELHVSADALVTEHVVVDRRRGTAQA